MKIPIQVEKSDFHESFNSNFFQILFGVGNAISTGEDVNGRGFAGPSSVIYDQGLDVYWPVTGCNKHSHCWASNVSRYPGWETYDVKFLMCNVQTGTCICKTGYMDADDDRYNGCETKVSRYFPRIQSNM